MAFQSLFIPPVSCSCNSAVSCVYLAGQCTSFAHRALLYAILNDSHNTVQINRAAIRIQFLCPFGIRAVDALENPFFMDHKISI